MILCCWKKLKKTNKKNIFFRVIYVKKLEIAAHCACIDFENEKKRILSQKWKLNNNLAYHIASYFPIAFQHRIGFSDFA